MECGTAVPLLVPRCTTRTVCVDATSMSGYFETASRYYAAICPGNSFFANWLNANSPMVISGPLTKY